MTSGSDHGLTLEVGVYVAKIQPGSVAAKEGVIAVGDRIVNVSSVVVLLLLLLVLLLIVPQMGSVTVSINIFI